MICQLFDNQDRHETGWRSNSEPIYSYLNRSGMHSSVRLRAALEDWFSRYPIEHQPEFQKRFQSTDNNMHGAAFFELVLHELALRLCGKVEVHPKIPDERGNRPDFLVRSPIGGDFYLEAVVATNRSERESAAKARLNTFYDSLRRLDSPNFLLFIDKWNWWPDTPIPGKKILRGLTTWLRSLDPDKVETAILSDEAEDFPSWTYEHEGQSITFLAMPKAPESRGASTGALGFFDCENGFVQSDVAIRDNILKKSGKYGELDLPYIVAVNTLDVFADWDDVERALLGGWHSLCPGSITERAITRKHHGAWTGPNGPRYTRVSAVLVTLRLEPFTLMDTQVRLYHNPWAKRPYSGDLSRLTSSHLGAAGFLFQQGASLADIFALPHGCPNE